MKVNKLKCDICGVEEDRSRFVVVGISQTKPDTDGWDRQFDVCRTCLPMPIKSATLLERLKSMLGLT